MSTVRELYPGALVESPIDPGRRAWVIVIAPHPLWQGLAMVGWRMADDSVTFDALHWDQDVGQVTGGRILRPDLEWALGVGGPDRVRPA
jgi:hypothetical protein